VEGLMALASGQDDPPPSVRLGALCELGNRLYGRPEQAISVTGESGSSLDTARAQLVAALLEQIGRSGLPDVTAAALPEKAEGEAPEDAPPAEVAPSEPSP
jgi:hypothetical protein